MWGWELRWHDVQTLTPGRLPDLEAAVKAARAVGATGVTPWRSKVAPEVEVANTVLRAVSDEAIWGVMFAKAIVASMAEQWSLANYED